VYKFKHQIGEFNTLPIFENWDYTTDEGGGVDKVLNNSFYAWAKMTPRVGGRTFIAGDLHENNQSTWIYDMEVFIRYTDNITSDSTMVWDNKRYAINYYSIDGEGKERFIRLYVTMTDNQLVTGGIITPTTPAYVYNYEGIGGESEVQANELINKTILGVFKDGLSKEVIFLGTPDDGQVKYTPAEGKLEFGISFFTGEKLQVQYI